jgi:hypothetical protein
MTVGPSMTVEAGRRPSRWCGALTRGGKHCERPAGWGTDHVGWGHCKLHGGSSRSGRMAAARLEALASMPPAGGESDVEPIDALLFCVRREAARGVWLRLRLELVDPDGSAISDPAAAAAELHRLEAQATERLARFSKMALDAGVAERKVRLVARQAEALAHAFTTALDQHPMAARLSNQGVTPVDDVPGAMEPPERHVVPERRQVHRRRVHDEPPRGDVRHGLAAPRCDTCGLPTGRRFPSLRGARWPFAARSSTCRPLSERS